MSAGALAVILIAAPNLFAQADADTATSWKRRGVCYEIYVRSFYDSDGDGIGDLKGLTQKLDYLNDGDPRTTRDLGATCVWLMPVAESPSQHGYDVTNYYRVEPDYGTNEDFKRFVSEAHRRGIHVLVDMVLNHASSEHPYFQEALRDTASRYRSWFRFSPTKPNQKGPVGPEAWFKSPVRDEYYYAVFCSCMPDLNYDTKEVREEAKKVARYWIEEMGVDGFRLDAVRYLVEEGDSLVSTPGTHALLREYGAYVRQISPTSYTVGEVTDSLGAVLTYYPDQLDSYFAFDQADAIINAVRGGSAKNLLDGYLRLQRELPTERYSPFLRNHDQTRTMTELRGDVNKAKLAATLLLTLPGLPFVYYGEEIGMAGDKPDPRLRTPMQWNHAANVGFTTNKPFQALQPDSLIANVQTEEADPASLLNRYRKLIHLRSDNAALGGGDLLPLLASSESVAAYLRRKGKGTVLVVANLGTVPLAGVTISSAQRALPSGRYAAKALLGNAPIQPVRVGSDGRLSSYVPIRRLAPLQAYVVELTRGR